MEHKVFGRNIKPFGRCMKCKANTNKGSYIVLQIVSVHLQQTFISVGKLWQRTVVYFFKMCDID